MFLHNLRVFPSLLAQCITERSGWTNLGLFQSPPTCPAAPLGEWLGRLPLSAEMDGDKVENGKVENLSQGKVAHKLLFCNQSGPRFALSGLAVEEKWLWSALLLPESLLMFCFWQMWNNYFSFKLEY